MSLLSNRPFNKGRQGGVVEPIRGEQEGNHGQEHEGDPRPDDPESQSIREEVSKV